jgi:ATPase subunit of ABC transporter with duplicated ATPase domains
LNISECCRIGIIGKNGAGKSTLLQLIAGSLPAVGDIWQMPGLEVAFLEQQTVDSMQQQQQSPLEYMQSRFPKMKDDELYGMLEQFGIDTNMASRAMNSLSTGQCMRIALARIAAEEAHLLVLDEPTSHLDIFSIDALVSSLRNFEGGVIFATHDRYLLDEVADQILIVSDSNIQEKHVRLESEVINLDKRQRTWHERALDPS